MVRAFGSRAVFAGPITAVFAALAWADWIGLGGAQPAWWLLPVAVVLAVGSVDEIVRLFATRDIQLPAWLLRPAVVAVVLAAAAGAEAFAAASSASGRDGMARCDDRVRDHRAVSRGDRHLQAAWSRD
jgi:hypothetical protein